MLWDTIMRNETKQPEYLRHIPIAMHPLRLYWWRMGSAYLIDANRQCVWRGHASGFPWVALLFSGIIPEEHSVHVKSNQNPVTQLSTRSISSLSHETMQRSTTACTTNFRFTY